MALSRQPVNKLFGADVRRLVREQEVDRLSGTVTMSFRNIEMHTDR